MGYADSISWMLRLLCAHLVTDFLLQPSGWIVARKQKHFAAPALYAHAVVTAFFAWLLAGPAYWGVSLVIGATHALIDGWKSYQKDNWKVFAFDQFLHLAVIGLCWVVQSGAWHDFASSVSDWRNNRHIWVIGAGLLIQTMPASILIGLVTREWRLQIPDDGQSSLAHAGKYIGMIERILIFLLVLRGQYEIVGFLIALKGLLRFADEKRSETKTEYLMIGTLLSVGIALLSGLLAARLLAGS
jgi:hypothetical protein